MPIEYKAYGCKFKCGHSRSSNKAFIAEHEAVCINDIKQKACRTCCFNVRETEGFFCEEDRLPEGKTFVRNCRHWRIER